ncbi:MAG: hypothetical protein VB111_02520 [Clostridiaceae bacterium]|nr:hypothetical protein [Clostridiaceae bacterium]
MREDLQKLTEWVIHKIQNEYPDDVALLIALEGHEVDGDGHGVCFDYYIPATQRGNGLARTFIIDGVGHDLYPRSWERTERTANLEDPFAYAVSDGVILYSRSPEDTVRFERLRDKLRENLANKRFVYRKALERIDAAMDLYRNLMFEDTFYKARLAAGYIADYLTCAILYLNGTVIRDYRVPRASLLQALPAYPEALLHGNGEIPYAKTAEELRTLTHTMIKAVRAFAAERTPAPESRPAPDFQNLADWYQELSLTWRRIAYYSRTGNTPLAFVEGCYLQGELNIVGAEFSLPEMPLLDAFDAADLAPFAARAAVLEKTIIDSIESHGVRIDRYASVDDFLAKNP